jgi:NADH:ubiquinone oxidoreductase subunit 6 (subunit J)
MSVDAGCSDITQPIVSNNARNIGNVTYCILVFYVQLFSLTLLTKLLEAKYITHTE